MPRKQTSPRKKKRGGSLASDAVNNRVSDAAWHRLDQAQSTYPGLSGGAMSWSNLFPKSTKYVLNHQSLRGGTSSSSSPAARLPAGHAPHRTGQVSSGALLNYDGSSQITPFVAKYPSTIGRDVSFQLSGGSKHKKPANKKKASSPRRPKKAQSPFKLPTLKQLQKDIQKIFADNKKKAKKKA